MHSYWFVFFFNDTATTEIYTLSLHDALPISALTAILFGLAPALRLTRSCSAHALVPTGRTFAAGHERLRGILVVSEIDRKSTRLNSSHANISYAVFCLKKKKQ